MARGDLVDSTVAVVCSDFTGRSADKDRIGNASRHLNGSRPCPSAAREHRTCHLNERSQ
jgi:hypothetical protein